MLRTYCDICNNEITSGESHYRLALSHVSTTAYVQQDICKECVDKSLEVLATRIGEIELSLKGEKE